MCFFGADKIRTKMTMATSPRPGLNSGFTSNEPEADGFAFGPCVASEKGYDSGKVTGKLFVTGVDERLRSTAFSEAGF